MGVQLTIGVWNIIYCTFFLLYCGHDQPVVSGEGNWSTGQKPLPNPKSLATFFKCCGQDSNLGSGERKLEVNFRPQGLLTLLYQSFSHFSGFLHQFVLAKLATSSILGLAVVIY